MQEKDLNRGMGEIHLTDTGNDRLSFSWSMEQHGLEPVVNALKSLGYKPESALWPAALRMTRDLNLLSDLLGYVQVGQPPLKNGETVPPQLTRILPGGYTVASLVENFKFEIVGAFLMASELLADKSKAMALLQRFIERGYWKTMSDGTRVKVVLPAAKKHPRCPECGKLFLSPGVGCPLCNQ